MAFSALMLDLNTVAGNFPMTLFLEDHVHGGITLRSLEYSRCSIGLGRLQITVGFDGVVAVLFKIVGLVCLEPIFC